MKNIIILGFILMYAGGNSWQLVDDHGHQIAMCAMMSTKDIVCTK